MSTKYEKGTFIVFPNKEIMRGKPAEMQAIYLWLCNYADESGKCFPARTRIAEDIGSNIKTVDKYLKQLVEEEIIDVDRGGQTKRSNRYQLLLKENTPQKRGTIDTENGTNTRTENGALTQPILTQSNITQDTVDESPVPEEPVASVGLLPERLGSTPVKRLISVYKALWQQKYHSPYIVSNYGKITKLFNSLLQGHTEQQVAVLLLTHFQWYGGSGNDQKLYKWLSDNGFPLEYMVKNQAIYIAFLTNVIRLCYTSPEDVSKYLARHLKTIL